MDKHENLWIGGEWIAPASRQTIDVISPFTEEVIARVPEACAADIDRAVGAARQAMDEGPWPHLSPRERGEKIRALGAGIAARAQDFAEVITREMGSPATFSMLGQVGASLMVLESFAALAERIEFEEARPGLLGPTLVRRLPVGVAAGIIPWNVPLFISTMKLGAAMVAGAPIVLKPAPETPLDAILLAEVLDSIDLPRGVVSIVPAGRETGELLVRHPGVDKVSFTGSTAGGRRVAAICGEMLKRCTLELGGKSAAILLDDVDLPAALPLLMPNAIMNNGQACLSQTRILAPRARYAEVVDALAQEVLSLTVGDPTDPTTAVGPLVAARQRDRALGYIGIGRDEGARVVVGGGRPSHLPRGWFVEPTLFAGVDNAMRIAREEIFGPVLVVIPYDDECDALRIANDSEYGLSGSVWTRDRERGLAVARRVRTGTLGVNAMGTMDMSQPFGGFKASGIGRECGPEGVAAFLEVQTIVG